MTFSKPAAREEITSCRMLGKGAVVAVMVVDRDARVWKGVFGCWVSSFPLALGLDVLWLSQNALGNHVVPAFQCGLGRQPLGANGRAANAIRWVPRVLRGAAVHVCCEVLPDDARDEQLLR